MEFKRSGARLTLKTRDKRRLSKFDLDHRKYISIQDILALRVKKIILKSGFSMRSLKYASSAFLYADIFYELLLMVTRDVINGVIVYTRDSKKSSFYIRMEEMSVEAIATDFKDQFKDTKVTEEIDLKVTNYRIPRMVFDTGYSKAKPCAIFMPLDLYNKLKATANTGQVYNKPSNATDTHCTPEEIEKFIAWDESKRKNTIRL